MSEQPVSNGLIQPGTQSPAVPRSARGCKYCYADRLAPRLKAMGNRRYVNGFEITLHHDLVDLPKQWKKPKKIFVNSMSDLFHEAITLDFIQSVFDTIEEAKHHTFQVLTKRPERATGIGGPSPMAPKPLDGDIRREQRLHS